MSQPLKEADFNTHYYSQKDIDSAWDNFLCSGGESKNLPVREMIANSWGRCLSQGVNPQQTAAPLLATEGTLHILRQKKYGPHEMCAASTSSS